MTKGAWKLPQSAGGGTNISDATATEPDVVAGKTFYSGSAPKKTGTMTDNGTVSTDITTKAQEVTIAAGKHSGAGIVKIAPTEQAKIIATNIKKDVTILGVTGTLDVSPDVLCPANGYVPDPTIPVPDSNLDNIVSNISTFVPTDSYTYLLYILDRRKSVNTVFISSATTAVQNIVMSTSGATLVTNANNTTSFNLANYSEDIVIIRLRFNASTVVPITASQPTSFVSAGLIGIISSVLSASISCPNQIYLKRIVFLKAAVNIATLNLSGCSLLYDIVWADTTFASLTSVASAFRYCGFRTLTGMPTMPAVTNASYFVADCLGIEEHTMPFSFSQLNNVSGLFYNTPKLKKINGVGVGGTLVCNCSGVTNQSYASSMFFKTAFDGTIQLAFPSVTLGLANVISQMPNLRYVEFTSLSVNSMSYSGVVLDCPSLISVKCPDSFRGTTYIMSLLSGIFNSLEEVQYPMDEASDAYYAGTYAGNVLPATLTPKLKVIRGRLKYNYTPPAYTPYSGLVAAFSWPSAIEGKCPNLEEYDYPGVAFTNMQPVNFVNLKKFTSKIVVPGDVKFLNCNFPPEAVAAILANTTPWTLYTNNSFAMYFTGNKVALPIVYAAVYSASTTTITEDTWKIYRANTAGTPVVGMKHARTFLANIAAGTAGASLIVTQTSITGGTAQALKVGDPIVFVGSYNSNTNVTNGINAGLPIFTKLYIKSVSVVSNVAYYEVSATPGGSSITYSTTVASTISINCRTLMDIIGVTSDATYWYITFNRSTFNATSSYNNGLSGIFGAPIDSDVMLLLNRGLQY